MLFDPATVCLKDFYKLIEMLSKIEGLLGQQDVNLSQCFREFFWRNWNDRNWYKSFAQS